MLKNTDHKTNLCSFQPVGEIANSFAGLVLFLHVSVCVISVWRTWRGKTISMKKGFAVVLTFQLYQGIVITIISSKFIFCNPYPAAVEFMSASSLYSPIFSLMVFYFWGDDHA